MNAMKIFCWTDPEQPGFWSFAVAENPDQARRLAIAESYVYVALGVSALDRSHLGEPTASIDFSGPGEPRPV